MLKNSTVIVKVSNTFATLTNLDDKVGGQAGRL
jgi:hypothetical protein